MYVALFLYYRRCKDMTGRIEESMKKSKLGKLNSMIACVLCMLVFGGCNTGPESEQTDTTVAEKKIVVGFSQVGAESDWRNANTESMKSALSSANGYTLIYEDGQQKQANQIRAIRTFIQQEVDYIVLAPVTENGWDTVLQEAKDAGIPVIIVDRMVNVSDDALFTCCVGSDFELEAKKVAEWLKCYMKYRGILPEEVHIVNIQGTPGATSQIGRTKGLSDAAKAYGWDLLAEVPGDYTQAKSREVMEGLLKQYDNINVVYCENDNEAFGAIEAIEAAGKTVGADIKSGEIMVVSFDGVNEKAVQYVTEGKITCIAECNPLHGPRVQALIEALEAGETPEKFLYVDEQFFSAYQEITELNVDGILYPVTFPLKEEVTEESTEIVPEETE